MKKLFVLLFVAGALAANAQEFTPLKIGSAIPLVDVAMRSTLGKAVSIEDAKLKNGVLVMFSCNTCPVVKKYQSRTVDAIKKARTAGFGVIIINSNEGQRSDEDSYQAMQVYGKQHGYNNVWYVVDKNSKMADAFGATRTPECFLFDASGKLVYHGAIDDSAEIGDAKVNYLAVAFAEVASGKSVATPESRSVGCSIKRL